MIDPRQNAYYQIATEKLPQLSIHQPKNLNEIINLSDLLMNNNAQFCNRGSYFVAIILLMYSI